MSSISPDTLTFLSDLKENNNRPWFEINKPRYEAARANFVDFIAELQAKLLEIEPIVQKDPKKFPYRIYRDVRFSKNKDPYKLNISALIERAPNFKKMPMYIHIQPGNNSFLAGGAWEPEKEQLKAIRSEIDYNGDKLVKILAGKPFKTHFKISEADKLKTVPKGYNADNPHIEFLKLKQFIISKPFTDEEITAPDFADRIIEAYKAALGFLAFFDEAVANPEAED
ncbi:MAG: DUF2461 domain-containing protein [Bacteroidota bacterium]